MSEKSLQMGYDRDFGEEFQRHLLAVLARNDTAVQRFRSALNYRYFSGDILRSVARALFEYVDEYSSIPTRVTLQEKVKDIVDGDAVARAEKVIRSLYADDISDSQAVLDMTVEFGKTQAMVHAVLKAAELVDNGQLQKARTVVEEATQVGADTFDYGILYDEDNQERDRIYARRQDSSERVPTGIVHLDQTLEGGLDRGSLGSVLALPSVGKSTALINFGFGAIIHGFDVMHYTLEMSDEAVYMRYDDRMAGPDIKYRTTDLEKYKRILSERVAEQVSGNLIIKRYPNRGLTPTGMRSHLAVLASEGFVPDVVLVDYADIMAPDRGVGETRLEQAGIYEDLRALAVEHGVAIWVGSQAAPSRTAEKELLDRFDFTESHNKEMTLDVVVSLNQTDQEAVEKKARLYKAKDRDREAFQTIECELNRRTCTLRSISALTSGGGVPASQPKRGSSNESSRKKSRSRPSKRVASDD